jgi:transcriptional regulator with XRE-family HTH domain
MRTRQIRGEVQDVGYAGRASAHANAGPTGDQSAARDDQVGQMFRNMRAAMGVSRETIARRLATAPSTIDNFEAGAVSALPHWKETARIVRSYCELLRMTPEPILRRIHDRLLAIASQPRSPDPPPPRVLRSVRTVRTEPPAAKAEPAPVRPTRRRRARTLFALSAPIALLVGVAILAQVMPGLIYRAVGVLPGTIEAPVRTGLDYIVLLMAPRRDGLRWIEVGDPRLRKADKLPTSTR